MVVRKGKKEKVRRKKRNGKYEFFLLKFALDLLELGKKMSSFGSPKKLREKER